MPHPRLYVIADSAVAEDADDFAAQWDPYDGSTTFSSGQPLSADSGATITHRAANTLADHPSFTGTPIDVDLVLDRLKSPPLLDIYACDDPYGEGAVHRLGWNGSEVTETLVGTGDLQALALSDAGLQVYQTESVL
jgi:hypothetical protein